MTRIFRNCIIGVIGFALSACGDATIEDVDNGFFGVGKTSHEIVLPQIDVWPARDATIPVSDAEQARVTQLLAAMSMEEKVAQLVIGDVTTITPYDLENNLVGAVLAGGNSGPNGTRYATASEWMVLADELYEASLRNPDNNNSVPPLFGIDAVHGHNNVKGAVVFPHNVGLGAANDPGLVFKIGAATAHALAATGHDWTFAPTVALAENVRWGRAYESFSADPQRVRRLSQAYVAGVQQQAVGSGTIIATAKHFIGDGATLNGKDQGDTTITERMLAERHGAGYFGALDAGVMTVMASYSSWNGEKLHGHKYLLTDVLKNRLGFNGFVVGDWDAHAQLRNCTADDCVAAINAGVDMLMAPSDWRALRDNLLDAALSGEISEERLNDAAGRVLLVKLKAGLLDGRAPSDRIGAGVDDAIAGDEARQLAQSAVRASQVLLKNDNELLPLTNVKRLVVIGEAADDFAIQSGGWTLHWQSEGLTNNEFPVGSTFLDGMRAHARKNRTMLRYDPLDKGKLTPDAAIVVLHERPYAEFFGDRISLSLPKYNKNSLRAISRLKKEGVPTVVVMISGRPLWIEDTVEKADAFVASWLPGTEGAAIADLLFGETIEGERTEFTGTLSFDWPAQPKGRREKQEVDLFPIGYGLTLQDEAALVSATAMSDDASQP